MSPRSSSEKERHTVFYGRGGAGNVAHRADPTPPPQLDTPTLKSKVYTTGRGGTGNMAVNDAQHPEVAREHQDLDIPHVALAAEKNYITGRGGAGNVHHLTEKEQAEAKAHNAHVRAHT